MIVVFQVAVGLDSSDIPIVKSLKARYKGTGDGDFSVCKNLSNPIRLRVSPMALLENSIASGCGVGGNKNNRRGGGL